MLQVLRKLGLFWVMGLAISQVSVHAHPAFSSEFDKDLPFIHRGTIVRMECVNPHTWLHVDVVKEDGTTELWMMEGGTPNTLLRAGMTNIMLQPGTEIIVRGYQSKDADCEPRCRGSGRDITFADGSRIFMGSSGTGAPRDGADPRERARGN